MTLNKYLHRRGEKGIFQLRMAIPAECRRRGGPRERIKSLGTSDPKLASERAIPLVALWRTEWTGRKSQEPPPLPTSQSAQGLAAQTIVPDLDKLAVEIAYMRFGQAWEEKRGELAVDDDAGWSKHMEAVRDLHKHRVRQVANKDPGDDLRIAARSILRLTHRDYAPSDSEIEQLAQAVAHAQIDTANRELAACQGHATPEPVSEAVRAHKQKAADAAAPGETLLEQFELYESGICAAKQRRAEGMAQDRMVVSLFADFVGRNRSVRRIKFEDAKQFVDALPRIPPHFLRRKIYRGLSLREAIENRRRDGDETLSIVTQERYISNLSGFFTWLKSDKGGRLLAENPFNGLHLDVKKVRAQNALPPFTADEIVKIIASPLFTGFAAKKLEYEPGSLRANDWRKWIPLVCMFTGARISEVAQLHVRDISTTHDIPFVEFREEEAAGQRTKSSKCRIVPVHSQLVAMGFMAFVQSRKAVSLTTGNPQLFPEIEPDSRGEMGGKPGRWWRNYLDRIGLDKRGQGSHSFRHTISDQFRAAGFLDAQFGPLILGHSSQSVTAGYGGMMQGTIEMRRDMIEAVKFVPIERGRVVEGGMPVDFSRLYPQA